MTDPLLKTIESENITIDITNLPVNKSAAFQYNGRCYIALDRHLRGNALRVHAAHEAGHCARGAFYNMYSDYDVIGKQERKADEWAITQLVPERDYLAAMKGGVSSAAELADEFSITEQFARKVMAYYRSKFISERLKDEMR